jgi:hypothetical protein
MRLAVVLLRLWTTAQFAYSAPAGDDRDEEEVECSSTPDLTLIRNGLGDNSYSKPPAIPAVKKFIVCQMV